MIRYILILTICLGSVCAWAQTNPNAELEAFVPPSVTTPEAATLGKFGEIPVSNYTGVPDISIPIHVLQLEGYNFPIVLRYHSSGVQVSEEATWVGLGWDLSVGGSIVHNAVAENDERDGFHTTTVSITDKPTEITSDFIHFERSEDHAIDPCGEVIPTNPNLTDRGWMFNEAMNLGYGQPDNYSISLPGYSGKFILERVTMEPKISGRLSKYIEISGSQNTSWEAIDLDGVKYYFDSGDEEYIHQVPGRSYGIDPETTISKLSKIELTSGKEIDFSYEDGYYEIRYGSSKITTISSGALQDTRSTASFSDQSVKYLSLIETDFERIVFELSDTYADRKDLDGITTSGVYSAKRLNAIHIYDNINNELIKSFEFSYGFFDSGSSYDDEFRYRLKLESVKEVGWVNGVEDRSKPAHEFQYNSTALPPKGSNSIDHWGYSNGISNSDFLPEQKEDLFILNETLYDDLEYMPQGILDFILSEGSANRGMDENAARAGILNRVTYPTSGYSDFEYEANRFTNYSIFDADEVTNGADISSHIQLLDYNKSIDNKTITLPTDGNGKIGLFEFNVNFSKLALTPYSDFNDAYVQVQKKTSSGVLSLLDKWVIQDVPFFLNNNYFSVGPETIWYNLNPSDEIVVSVYLPDIPDFTNSGYPPAATVSCDFKSINLGQSKPVSIGGGLRVKSITHYDNDGSFANKKSYNYVDENGNSSGILMSPPKYIAFDYDYLSYHNGGYHFDGYKASVGSTSFRPLSRDAQGGLVGYSRVEVEYVTEQGDSENGMEVYHYRNQAFPYGGLAASAVTPPNIIYHDNGLLDSVVYYSEPAPGNLRKIKRVVNTYQPILEDRIYGIVVEETAILNDLDCSAAPSPPIGRYSVHYYPVLARWFKPIASEEENYDETEDPLPLLVQGASNTQTISKSSDGIDLSYSYEYNEVGQLIKFGTTDSRNISREIEYTFPFEFKDQSGLGIIDEMNSTQILNKILESRSLRNGLEYNRTSYDYLLHSTGSILMNKIEKSTDQGISYYEDVTDVKYDAGNNIVEVEKDGLVTSYLFGGGYRYLILQAVGASFQDLENELTVTYSALQTMSDSQLETEFSSLRTQLPNALITSYLQYPLVGPVQVTDENGISQYFDYDSYGRLIRVRDQDNFTLQQMNYNFKNGSN